MILVLGKAGSHRAPNLGCMGAESPGWLDVSPKNSSWDMMHELACCRDEAANHQLPIATGFWIIQTVSTEECLSLTKLDADSLLYLLSHFGCDSHTVHMFTQRHLLPPLTSTVKSSLFTLAHSSPFSLAARLHQCHANILVILTMAGLLPDRPCLIVKWFQKLPYSIQ